MPGHRVRTGVAAVFLSGVLLLTAGCWDLHELQSRNFILATAIDSADQGGRGPAVTQVETYTQSADSKPFRLSLQILRLTAPSAQDNRGANASRTFVLSTTGKSMFEMGRDMLGQSSKALYYEHLQAVIISEEALKKSDLKTLLDFWQRDSEMRWRIKAFVTSGEARRFLDFIPPTGESGGIFLQGLVLNQKKNSHVPGARTDLGFITQALDNGNDILIPRIEMADKVVKVSGCAIIRQGRFAGYADEYTTRGLKLLMGTEKSMVIPVDCQDHPGETVVFEMYHQDTKLTPHFENGQLYFTLDIIMEGNLGEVSCRAEHQDEPYPFYRMAEQAFADEVKRNVLYSYEYLQSLHSDPVRFGQAVKAHFPREWKDMQDRWDEEIFPSAPLYVTVNVTIRGLGERM